MGWLYLYRLASFALAMILALVVIGLAAQTDSAEGELPDQLKKFHYDDIGNLGKEFGYAHTGIAAGALTLVSLPIMLALDFFGQGKLRSPVLLEIIWLSLLWLLYIVASALSFSQADFSAIPGSCDILSNVPALVTICKDAHPLGIVSIIAAVVLFLYALILLVVAATHAGRGDGIWGSAVKDAEKA